MDFAITRTVGSIVAEDFRSAAVLTSYGIDFCCQGGRSIAEACKAKGVDPAVLEQEIEEALRRGAAAQDFSSWSLTRLADHIEGFHHAFVRARIPVLLKYVEKLCAVHGGRHPELNLVEMEMKGCADAMAAHMRKEEVVLFPFIRRMERAIAMGEALPEIPFGTVGNPIGMMEQEHSAEGERLQRIAKLTNGHENPPDGCATYAAAMSLLKEFESDLHLHVHLENNILFPKAMAMEAALPALG